MTASNGFQNGFHQEAKALVKKSGGSESVWDAVFRWLPSRDVDSDYWWQVTGPQMATMFEEAGYSRERQYENLLIHYHWTVPYMGSKPDEYGRLKWNCILSQHGISMVYSWKWNDSNPSSKPDIRIGFEPIGKHSGTAVDPVNQQSSKELLHSFARRMPLDLNWANHFLSTCYDPDTKYWQAKEAGVPLATTMMLGYDFLHDGLTLKTYFFPRLAGQRLLPMDRWDTSLREVLSANSVSGTTALDTLLEFLKTSPEGQLLMPTGLAIDNGTNSPSGSSTSRLKFYFRGPKTTFASVREIMTLGGKIPDLEPQLQSLHTLLKDVTGLPQNYPDDADVPVYHGFGTGTSPLGKAAYYLYYFDIAPEADLPDIKFYTPLTHYGQDDRKSAQGITRWMESQGRGSYCENYLRMLEKVAGERTLESGNGLQSYLSCLFKKDGELDVTSYFLTQRC
ncbi:aromatic prenyltransferase [Aspergillus californicus]